MSAVMSDLYHRLHKLLVLEEFQDAQVHISLLSYAAQGDLITHCEREPLGVLMAREDERLEELKELQGEGKTCISQALERAIALCVEGEPTAISLHSDGFASDPSYAAERARLIQLVEGLSAHPSLKVTLNTIAHARQSDFALLSTLAQLGRGRCVVAEDIRAVYEALHHTTALIAQPHATPYPLEHEGLWLMYSRADRQVLSGEGAQLIEGFGATSARTLLRFTELQEGEEAPEEVSVVSGATLKGRELAVALSLAALKAGDLNTAKRALLSSASAPLINAHLNALSAHELGQMAHELERALLSGRLADDPTLDLTSLPARPSVLEVMSTLHRHRASVTFDLQALNSLYERRALPRRSADLLAPLSEGQETSEQASSEQGAPSYRARRREGALTSLAFARLNHTTATLNLTLQSPAEIINSDGEVIHEVAGVSLDDLQRFNSYTVVSDGRLHLPSLPLFVSDDRLLDELLELGALSTHPALNEPFSLSLSRLPLMSDSALEGLSTLGGPARPLDGLFKTLARARFLRSALNAMLKDRASGLSLEQREALASLGVSERGFLSPSTTLDQERFEALRDEGSLKRAVRYEISLGNDELLSLTRLPSANAYLHAQFLVHREGGALERPQLSDLYDLQLEISERPKTRSTPIQRLLKPVLEAILGKPEAQSQLWADLTELGVSDERLAAALPCFQGSAWRRDTPETRNILSALRDELHEVINERFMRDLSPIVFSLGCNGMIPRHLKGLTLTPTQLKEERPQLSMTEAEEEGVFIKVGEREVLSVTTALVSWWGRS
jgi:hypothetical protein